MDIWVCVYLWLLGIMLLWTFHVQLSNCFPKWLCQFNFLPATHKGFSFSACWVICLFHFSYPSRYEGTCHLICSSLVNKWCWASFHMLCGHLHIFVEVSIQMPILYISLSFCCTNSLHILDTWPWLQVHDMQIYYSEGCLFSFLMVYDILKQKVLSLMKSDLFFCLFCHLWF